jgi:hypothetical protein
MEERAMPKRRTVAGSIAPRAAPSIRRARLVIEVEVPEPTATEQTDLSCVVAVEAANLVAEIFGPVFSDEYVLTKAEVEWRPAE